MNFFEEKSEKKNEDLIGNSLLLQCITKSQPLDRNFQYEDVKMQLNVTDCKIIIISQGLFN
jgi:hypothetical protein